MIRPLGQTLPIGSSPTWCAAARPSLSEPNGVALAHGCSPSLLLTPECPPPACPVASFPSTAAEAAQPLGKRRGVEGRLERRVCGVDAEDDEDARIQPPERCGHACSRQGRAWGAAEARSCPRRAPDGVWIHFQKRGLKFSRIHVAADSARSLCLTFAPGCPIARPPRAEDGVFWMEYNDWLINYRTLYFCHIYPQEQARGSGVDPDLPGTPGIPASTPAAANRHPDKVK